MLELYPTPSDRFGSARFEHCLEIVLREGGNSPETRGRASDGAVTRSSITRSAYLEGYWNPTHARDCPSPLDLVVFDCAVRSGVVRSIQTLQRALGSPDCDGTFTYPTRIALENCDGFSTAIKFLELRRAFYQDAAFKTFCKGKASGERLMHIDQLLDTIGAIA
jgi:lysozyme family protein